MKQMKTTKKAKYYVLTWDLEKQRFTPQAGLRCGPYSLWGLRRAIQRLRDMGYSCDYSSRGNLGNGSGDAYVLIEERAVKP